MKYVGVDLHKQVISACVVIQEDKQRKVIGRRNLRSKETESIARRGAKDSTRAKPERRATLRPPESSHVFRREAVRSRDEDTPSSRSTTSR